MSISPKLALLEEYALVARALSAPARLMLLEQLAQGERGVEALAEKTGLTIANCSQHLQQLRRAALVTSRRDGKAVIYRLTDAKTLELMDLLRIVAERNLAQVERILRGLSGGYDAPNRGQSRGPRRTARGRLCHCSRCPALRRIRCGPHPGARERHLGAVGANPPNTCACA